MGIECFIINHKNEEIERNSLVNYDHCNNIGLLYDIVLENDMIVIIFS